LFRIKLLTTVLVILVVGPFTWFAILEAVQIKQQLQKQHQQMKLLKTESVKLDKKLDETKAVKDRTAQDVQLLQRQANEALIERKQLETELGAVQ
jgi:cell division protein FtsB